MLFKTPFQRLLLALFLFTLASCSATPKTQKPTIASDDEESSTNRASQFSVDRSQPTSFNEYRAWRKAHDPEGEAYANYKEWEIAYKRWQLQQEAEANRPKNN